MARRLGAPVMEPPGNVASSKVEQIDVRAQPSAHRRHQVKQRRQRDDPRQARDRHAAGLTDAAEIVALEVHDHHVLGAILRGRHQLGAGGQVRVRAVAARARAFDRARLDHAVDAHVQEPFGGIAHHAPRQRRARLGSRQTAREPDRVRRGRQLAQRRRQPDRIARAQLGRQPARQVDLIDVAGAQEVPDPLDRARVHVPGLLARQRLEHGGRDRRRGHRQPRPQSRRRGLVGRDQLGVAGPRVTDPQGIEETKLEAGPAIRARRRPRAQRHPLASEVVGQPSDPDRHPGALSGGELHPRARARPRGGVRAAGLDPAVSRAPTRTCRRPRAHQLRQRLAAHHRHRIARDHVARDPHLGRRVFRAVHPSDARHAQPDRISAARHPARRLGRLQRGRRPPDHDAVRGERQAAEKNRYMYSAPEAIDTIVEM